MSWGSEQRGLDDPAAPQWNTPPAVIPPPSSAWHPQAAPVAVATSIVVVDATATARVGAQASVSVAVDAAADAALAADAIATWRADELVFHAGVAADAPTEVAMDATADASIAFDPGFDYTFPFRFGGPVALSAYATGTAVVAIDGTATAVVGANARALIEIVATAVSGNTDGFPHEFPFDL